MEQLLYLRGVSAEYYNYYGERTIIPFEQRLAFLSASGYDISNHSQIEQAIFELDAQQWKSWLKPFSVITLGVSEFIEIKVHPDEKASSFLWRIFDETHEIANGEFSPNGLEEVGEYYIDSVRYTAHRLHLGSKLPIGYYKIECRSGAALNDKRCQKAELMIAPSACYNDRTPQKTKSQLEPLLGISCQLYTLKSDRNWGIGDFGDLLDLVRYAAKSKMDLIALNPLHSPHMAGPDFASPYSPSDRRFLNPLYIDLESVLEYTQDKNCQEVVQQPEFQIELANLRETPLVDYDRVAKIKYSILNQLFEYFLNDQQTKQSPRKREFDEFVARSGQVLHDFSQYQSQHSGLSYSASKNPMFYQYMQWLCQQQLDQCQKTAIDNGMPIGLMGDLAVGAIKGGAEVGGNPTLFCNSATIGAPPDEFTKEGQNWNLPALDPIGLRQNNYQHFIQLLRANMNYCGALRIDHVMALLRLWWCLPEYSSGAYIYYPMDDLFAILALESHLNECIVIGEDMGVVPDELRSKMSESNVYSNKALYFERYQNQDFKRTHDHQHDAMLMVTSHDVSTLAGWWSTTDLAIKRDINMILDDQAYLAELSNRSSDKKRLLEWLKAENQLPLEWQNTQSDSVLEKAFDFELCSAILKSCAQSHSRIMLFQLDDLQLIEQPVNIPGTYREYPNWRRKQKTTLKTLFTDSRITSLLNVLLNQRKQS